MPFLKGMIRIYYHSKNLFIYSKELSSHHQVTIGEGEVRKINGSFSVENIKYSDIYRVELIDQLNRKWKVEWPSTKEIAELTMVETLFNEKEFKNTREITVYSEKIGNNYKIAINSYDGYQAIEDDCHIYAYTLNEYLKKFEKVIALVNMYLNKEIDKISLKNLQ